MRNEDNRWMAEALRLAEAALDHDEVPAGCVSDAPGPSPALAPRTAAGKKKIIPA